MRSINSARGRLLLASLLHRLLDTGSTCPRHSRRRPVLLVQTVLPEHVNLHRKASRTDAASRQPASRSPLPTSGLLDPGDLLIDPGRQEGVGHGEHHRPDENADEAEGDQAADDTGER